MSLTQKSAMQEMWQDSYLAGGEDYLERLYEDYLKKPDAVDAKWQQYFASLNKDHPQEIPHSEIQAYFKAFAQQKSLPQLISSESGQERKQSLVNELISAYRSFGHFQARLDPLGLMQQPKIPELERTYYGFSEEDLDKVFIFDHGLSGKSKKLRDIISHLHNAYCQSVGAEFIHINSQTERLWIEERLENPELRQNFSLEKQKRILEGLTAAEGLEKYLGSKYVGQKRFSLEGGDSLIPMLDELIQHAGRQHIQEIIIGMAHRGRLNVLVNILGKAPQQLFDEFEGKNTCEERSGDVKYHMGFSSDVCTDTGHIHLALAFNPSHLEIVSPVVTGSVFARQQRRVQTDHQKVMGVQIHGDAAIAGQGVVMETFALSQTKGYGTGGTVHIVVNNQVGFTTDPINSRSTFYCTDVAKIVQAPIFHVNADDPEAVLFVVQLALDYRMTFSKDVVIDLICYRRHGHNEADEPSATQPLMYKKIKQQLTTRQLYADRLVKEGRLPQAEVDAAVVAYRDALDVGKTTLPHLMTDAKNDYTVDWSVHLNQSLEDSAVTAVDRAILTQLGQQINTLPEGMVLQAQVAKVIESQLKMATGELAINWGYAENLAYATLLKEGYAVRLSGQDCGRGTFAHRHAVWHDYNNGDVYTPLSHINTHAHFEVIDSILSEEAVVAFEYGYATANPNTLVLWEAQFGDFANGAQVVVDQFISSGEQKWGRLCGLVMLLPHGYEGMGPEHSSARLERYLQLCAQNNMQVCVPTTPAQIFHLLRRQIRRLVRKPLIVMTPKALLRHKLAISTLDELSQGQFQSVIPEVDAIDPNGVQRIIVCSGKVYYDLLEERRRQDLKEVVIVRVEALYPFPDQALKAVLAVYKKAKEIIWCQEEPENQGAWNSVRFSIMAHLSKDQILTYVGRSSAAAPAVGSSKLHAKQQKIIVDQALRGNAS